MDPVHHQAPAGASVAIGGSRPQAATGKAGLRGEADADRGRECGPRAIISRAQRIPDSAEAKAADAAAGA